MSSTKWRRSSFCQADGCVEVARVDDKVLVGRSVNGHVSSRVAYDLDEFAAFLAGAKAGEFDRLVAEKLTLDERLAFRLKPDEPGYDAFYDATDDELAEMVPPFEVSA